MKRLVLAATAALMASAGTATAADMDREIGLIVSGVADKWAGVQFIDDGLDDDVLFASGGEGRLSFPVGNTLSIQNDFKYEYNENAIESPGSNDVRGPRYSYQFAAHVSHRDPSTFLIGAFGGVGGINSGSIGAPGNAFTQDNLFAGGEFQFYLNNFTLYGQAGYVETNNTFGGSLDDGFFARGVLRYFPTADSRLQVEGTYINMDYVSAAAGDMDAFIVKARYDMTLDLPLMGSTPLYLAYRGTFRDNCLTNPANTAPTGGFLDLDDHTFMIGTSYSFSGDMLTVDRQGATLDTPDFVACDVGQPPSDRRLKTDIVALGTDAAGNRIYSWKYKFDPVTTWVGVMAQDLVDTHPEALVTTADGYYAVRYDLIGAQMMTLEQWNSRAL